MENVIYTVENINHSTRPNEINFLFISLFRATATVCAVSGAWRWHIQSVTFYISLVDSSPLERLTEFEICSLALNFGKKKNEKHTHTHTATSHRPAPGYEIHTCHWARSRAHSFKEKWTEIPIGHFVDIFGFFYSFATVFYYYYCFFRVFEEKNAKQTAARRHSQFTRAHSAGYRMHILVLATHICISL